LTAEPSTADGVQQPEAKPRARKAGALGGQLAAELAKEEAELAEGEAAD
jgi:hypothetical protein